MRTLIGFSCLLFFTSVGFAEELATNVVAVAGKWHSQYGPALKETKDQAKPLLVVLESPEDPKHQIQQISTLADDPSQTDLFKKYILCRVDVTSDYGKKIAIAFKATTFPHTVVIDKTGAVQLAKRSGEIETSEWLSLLKTYQTGERQVLETSASLNRSRYSSAFCRT